MRRDIARGMPAERRHFGVKPRMRWATQPVHERAAQFQDTCVRQTVAQARVLNDLAVR